MIKHCDKPTARLVSAALLQLAGCCWMLGSKLGTLGRLGRLLRRQQGGWVVGVIADWNLATDSPFCCLLGTSHCAVGDVMCFVMKTSKILQGQSGLYQSEGYHRALSQ